MIILNNGFPPRSVFSVFNFSASDQNILRRPDIFTNRSILLGLARLFYRRAGFEGVLPHFPVNRIIILISSGKFMEYILSRFFWASIFFLSWPYRLFLWPVHREISRCSPLLCGLFGPAQS